MKRPAPQPTSRLPRFHRCSSCRFWVTRADSHCPNCGAPDPFPGPADTWRGVAEGFLGGGSLIALFAAMTGIPPMDLALPFLFGGIVGAPLGVAFDGFFRDLKRRPDCLRHYERTIKLRLQEIDSVLGRIETIRQHLGASPTPELRKVAEVLDAAEQTYPAHRDRYRVKLFEIDLARWQNAVEPYGYGWESLSFEGCERRLVDLTTLQQRGEELRSNLAQSEIAPELRLPLATRLDQVLALCEQFRQSLITRQALTVVTRARSVGEVPPLTGAISAEDRLSELSARAEIGEFAQGFASLEAEHTRIEAELEVSRLTLGAGRA